MSIKDKIKELIVEWETERLKEYCQSILKNNEATASSLLKIIGDIMKFVGNQFEEEEIFLPELIGSAETVKVVIDDILDPAIRAAGEEKETMGKVVIGTVESDVHSIGKDLVGSFLFSNGFEVYNLGVEVTADQFISKAEEIGADVIGLSSLLTMSMHFQKQVIDELKKRGLRNKYKVIVGGSPTSEDWGVQIGADGWADDAIETITLVKKLLNISE
ncbi:MAG: dimethylamine corrinoid protein 3 [Promethearchaeota archaeon]|nr:MAG: dimethylamine corrinoid protein 3 [Candidatus Lokiarchaeota archaeon]